MAKCTSCGAEIPDGGAFCRRCGARVSSSQPVYVYSDPRKRSDAVLGTWAYAGSVILLSLPLIGFVLQIAWACGATRNLNRRNLARAYLVITLAGVVLFILTSILVGPYLSAFLEQLLPAEIDLMNCRGLFF